MTGVQSGPRPASGSGGQRQQRPESPDCREAAGAREGLGRARVTAGQGCGQSHEWTGSRVGAPRAPSLPVSFARRPLGLRRRLCAHRPPDPPLRSPCAVTTPRRWCGSNRHQFPPDLVPAGLVGACPAPMSPPASRKAASRGPGPPPAGAGSPQPPPRRPVRTSAFGVV